MTTLCARIKKKELKLKTAFGNTILIQEPEKGEEDVE
jgi:hypothetical protein